MKFEHLTPMLWTNDLQATVAFYQTILGFDLDSYSTDWGWCHLHKNNVKLMFCKPNLHMVHKDPIGCTGSFYIYTEDVDDYWNLIHDKVTVEYPISNFKHSMREFAIYDNNGYLLQFGRELKENEQREDF